MIRHCVMFTWADGVPDDMKAKVAEELDTLPGLIPEIQKYEHGPDAGLSDGNYDYCAVADFADEVTTDVHGNVIAVKNPGAPLRVMLAGHCDQIGLIVNHIDSNGFIYTQSIGGWDTQVLLGQRMTVWTDAGPVFGLIARKPTHLLSGSERGKAPEIKDLWIDIGVADQAEAKKLFASAIPSPSNCVTRPCATNWPSRPAWTTSAGFGLSWRPCGASTRRN